MGSVTGLLESAGQDLELDVTLDFNPADSGRIEGRVVDQAGTPWEDLTLELDPDDDPVPAWWHVVAMAECSFELDTDTGEDGGLIGHDPYGPAVDASKAHNDVCCEVLVYFEE